MNEFVQYMNSPGSLNTHDLESPAKALVMPARALRLTWGPPPTPPCRVCGQGRSGLPGDDHAACRRQEATWREQAQTALPEVQAAYASARATENAATAMLAAAGVPDWLIDEEFGDDD